MIPDIYYHDVYLLFISIITFFLGLKYIKYSPLKSSQTSETSILGVFIFTIVLVLYIGLRPRSELFADMTGYVSAVEEGIFNMDDISWDTNYLFVPLMCYLSKIHASGEVAMVVLATIYFFAAMIATCKIFPRNKLLAMAVYSGAFITFSNATNGMKAGCATALFLCAVAYFENKYLSFFFLFASLGFHHAAQLLIAVYLICRFYKNFRFYLFVWVICLILSIFHVTYFQFFFGSITDEQGAGYLLIENTDIYSSFGGRTGFRYDFVLYSVIPIILGYYAIYKKKIIHKQYIFMLNIYTFFNAIWMLCMYASYTNRIAALGWGLYSLLILYPVLQPEWHRKKNSVVAMAAYGHLGFTLILHIIYY